MKRCINGAVHLHFLFSINNIMGPFDYIKAINKHENIMKNDSFAEKDYTPFLVNRGLSFFQDTILQVNEVNRLHFLDKRLQFDYLLNNIRPRNRWSKWLKPDKIENLEIVKMYFGFGNEKAKDALEVLSDKQIENIKAHFTEGGVEKT
jgi:hypothetical protein